MLRGSSSAAHSNAVLARVAVEAAEAAGLPAGSLSLVAGGGREELAELATQEGVVDLIIPRGGEGLKKALSAVATVPVIYAASGNCHVFVDALGRPRARRGDRRSTPRPSARASATRPRRCSCTRPSRRSSCPRVLGSLRAAGVELRGDAPRAADRRLASARPTEEDWADGVPRARARGARRRLGRGGDRARQPLRLRPLGGDRHARHRVRAGLPARRRRRLRLRQRLDALHRRRRVRDGRRDRQLDPEAARPRADRPARAVHVQVPGRGRRARSAR